MRRVCALVLALWLLAGCATSDVDPDATVRLSGRALDAAGRPLADTEVLLLKQADLGELVVGTVLAVGTLGTLCLVPDAPAVCARAKRTTTDADGRYTFEIKGSDTQGTLGSESTLSVVLGDRRAGTVVELAVKDTRVRVPDARLWRSRAHLAAPIALGWSALPEGAGDDVSYAVHLFDAGSGAPTYTQPAEDLRASIDPRLLEDVESTVAVAAYAALPGGRGTGDVRATYLSPRLTVAARAGAPPSRGRPCAPVTGRQGRVAGPAPGCPMTDGDLSSPARLDAGARARVVTGVALDLGATRPVGLVVARGFAGQVLVEVSADGRGWQPVGGGAGTTFTLVPPGGPSARYVRVRSATGIDQSLAAEVSVW